MLNRRHTIFIPVLFFFILALLPSRQFAGAKEILVVLRYDDYSTRSDTALEERIMALFLKHGVSCTFGVIPYIVADDIREPQPQPLLALSAEKAALLRRAVAEGNVEAALHGYAHQTIRPGVHYSEFGGVGYDRQVAKLTAGKELLEKELQTPIDVFIPPWNVYDFRTLRALEASGIPILSAALDAGAGAPRSSRMLFVPKTVGLPGARWAVERARRAADPQPVVVVLFHGYDFVEASPEFGVLTYDGLDQLLGWLAEARDVRIVSIADLARLASDLSAPRLMQNRILLRLQKVLPSILTQRVSSYGTYLGTRASRMLNCRLAAWVALLYGGILALAALVLRRSVSRWAWLSRFGPWPMIVGTAFLGLIAVYAIYWPEPSSRLLVVMVALAGILIGLSPAGTWNTWVERICRVRWR